VAYDAAEAEKLGLPLAIQQISQRVATAEAEIQKLEASLLEAAAPEAARMAVALVPEIAAAADTLGQLMARWSKLDCMASGNHGFITGQTQTERMGSVMDVLRSHRIWTPQRNDELYVRHRDDRDRMTIAEFLTILEEPV